jgi:hypothetical protein
MLSLSPNDTSIHTHAHHRVTILRLLFPVRPYPERAIAFFFFSFFESTEEQTIKSISRKKPK